MREGSPLLWRRHVVLWHRFGVVYVLWARRARKEKIAECVA
jgi:hypothetical protein